MEDVSELLPKDLPEDSEMQPLNKAYRRALCKQDSVFRCKRVAETLAKFFDREKGEFERSSAKLRIKGERYLKDIEAIVNKYYSCAFKAVRT